jgi:uncharacterized protein YutE (UPF0331/DUF86 family)
VIVRQPDKEKVKAKLDVIQSQRCLLEDFVGMSLADFASDSPELSLKYDACLHRLQIALQAVLDVAQYIASCTSEVVYKENKDVFDIIKKNGVITKKTADSFKSAIGVRNILVHQYEQVEPEVIYKIIREDLNDFDKFVVEVSDYLNKTSNDRVL